MDEAPNLPAAPEAEPAPVADAQKPTHVDPAWMAGWKAFQAESRAARAELKLAETNARIAESELLIFQRKLADLFALADGDEVVPETGEIKRGTVK